jgi:signal transduction histidine kinase
VVSDLEQGAERIRGLLDDLLALEREDGAERPKERVRLDRIVAEAASGRSSAQVTANAPVTVLGEPQALRRALENLIDNAEVHGPSGGTVSIALAVGNGQAELSVTDEGSGLSPVEAEHAFDRFWRGPDAEHRPGSGLGLAIVMATAERHGGTARAEGSTITIAIPVSPDGDKLAPETSPAPTARASGR